MVAGERCFYGFFRSVLFVYLYRALYPALFYPEEYRIPERRPRLLFADLLRVEQSLVAPAASGKCDGKLFLRASDRKAAGNGRREARRGAFADLKSRSAPRF